MSKKSSKGPAPFNNPFGQLKVAKPEVEKAATRAPAPPPAARRGSAPTVDDEAAMFLDAVGGVEAVRKGPGRVPAPTTPAIAHSGDDDIESVTRLAESVVSSTTFEVQSSGEQIAASRRGFDAGVLKRLKAGDFRVESRVDLHGLTRDEAARALELAVQRSRVEGHRCLLVITGRGLHSEHGEAVLKTTSQALLTGGRPARDVLAFCTARPEDGGAGAFYVLLRR